MTRGKGTSILFAVTAALPLGIAVLYVLAVLRPEEINTGITTQGNAIVALALTAVGVFQALMAVIMIPRGRNDAS